MRFSNGFLDEIRDRVPISAVIGARVTWDRKKTNVSRGDYWACCPFHGEKSPSFHCEDRKGRYHCFGCGVSGDHFRFLTDLDGMNFPEAVQQVADMAGIPMPAPDKQAEQREKERTSLLDVMEMATAFFQDQLNTASGARGRAYLRDRGLSGRTIETFKLGYAPDSRNALKEFLAGKNVPKDQIEACGLVVHGPEIPVSYDRFRDRIMFPILSSRERTIAFGGRAMSADAPAKYLNSNETELFHKGNVLFNFARARRAGQAVSRGRDEGASVIAVEGYMDVIALHQAGIENAVAPLGTALTENQLDLLWKMSPMPVLCFDGDGAGVRAAHRALDLALPHIRPGRSVRFALLPEGKDPDDLVRHDGRAPFDEVMAQARPLADMLWTRETMGGNFDTPEKRAELESRLRQIVAQIKDEDVRRHYSQAMRERLNTFFRPAQTAARGGFSRNERPQRGGGQAGRGQMAAGGPATASDRLMRSGMVMGHRDQPTLRESVMALSVVNHPELLSRDYDEIAAIDYDNRDLQRLWSAVLGITASAGARLTREAMQEGLEAQGFAPLLASLELQARGAGLWTAMPQAAHEDVADAFGQALALHKRSKALRRERIEIERDIAEAAEAEDGGRIDALMRALQEIQFEILRMENQEAIIDGFGVMSGRIKGAAGR